METVREFTYHGDRVSADRRCEAAVIARTRCGWVKFKECGKVLHGRRSPLKPKEVVYKRYVRPAILYGSESWCLKESEMGILRTKRSMVRAMCGVQLKNRKMYTDLMFMLGWNKTKYQLAMANSVHWCDHVLRREDGHILRRALDYEVEGQREKGRLKRTRKRQDEEERLKVGLRWKDTLVEDTTRSKKMVSLSPLLQFNDPKQI